MFVEYLHLSRRLNESRKSCRADSTMVAERLMRIQSFAEQYMSQSNPGPTKSKDCVRPSMEAPSTRENEVASKNGLVLSMDQYKESTLPAKQAPISRGVIL